jgi:structure-specific recognition protein 1
MASGGIGWKEAGTGLVTTVPSDTFQRLTWMRAMRGQRLCIDLADGKRVHFDNFPGEAFEEIAKFCEANYKLGLEARELSLKGHNWGRCELADGDVLRFVVGDKVAFELDLGREGGVTNVVQSAKDEVAVEFGAGEHQKGQDSLAEIRFFVPSKRAHAAASDTAGIEDILGEEPAEGAADEADDEATDEGAKALYSAIKRAANLDQVAGEILFALPAEQSCIVPRGRYAMDFGSTFLRLHGKSYSYKIPYGQIVKLFMVPKADDVHVLLVLALDPPIRQGQTRYPFLVFQFDKDEALAEPLRLSEAMAPAEAEAKWEGRLRTSYEGPVFEVVSQLLRVLAGQKLLVPGGYKGYGGATCIKAALKATEGYLYPLERNLLFLPKPPTLLPHADIALVEFSRLSNSRTFDVKFALRSGTAFAFSNAPKEDLMALEEYLRDKGVPMSKAEEPGVPAGAKRSAGPAGERTATAFDLIGDDSEDDEEYNEDEDDDSSVAEDYDSDASGSGSDDSQEDEDDEGDESEEEDEEEEDEEEEEEDDE